MRRFLTVMLIFLGTIAYGSVFVDDKEARKREIAIRQQLAITPPAGGGTMAIPADAAGDVPVLSPRPTTVLDRGPDLTMPPKAPSPRPSKNSFEIDDFSELPREELNSDRTRAEGT